MTIKLTNDLLAKPRLAELSNRAQRALLNRIDYIASIHSRFKLGVESGTSLKDLIDELELDIVVNLATPTEGFDTLTILYPKRLV